MPEQDLSNQSTNFKPLLDYADHLIHQSRENRRGIKLSRQQKAKLKTQIAQEIQASNDRIDSNIHH